MFTGFGPGSCVHHEPLTNSRKPQFRLFHGCRYGCLETGVIGANSLRAIALHAQVEGEEGSGDDMGVKGLEVRE